MKKDQNKINGCDGIMAGGHEYRIVNVSSRFFGPMYIIMKDGDYFFHAETSLLAANEIMKRSIG